MVVCEQKVMLMRLN